MLKERDEQDGNDGTSAHHGANDYSWTITSFLMNGVAGECGNVVGRDLSRLDVDGLDIGEGCAAIGLVSLLADEDLTGLVDAHDNSFGE